MLKGYPGVARWEQTDDVAQNALIRMDRALRAIPRRRLPDFSRLAAAQVRRELIDLARHYFGPRGPERATRRETGGMDLVRRGDDYLAAGHDGRPGPPGRLV